MQFEVSSKVVATAMALAAFAVAILAGLHAGNPTRSILVNALIAMIAGHIVGYVAGLAGERVIREHAASVAAAARAAADAAKGAKTEPSSAGGGAAR